MTKHIRALDGLRALSIAFVIYAHLSSANKIPKPIHMTSLGLEGVLMFFVLSGYLITSNILREKGLTGTINIKSFLIQRGFRLLPASFLFIFVCVLLSRVGYVQVTRGDLLHAVTYTMDYYSPSNATLMHLWSLSVEEQFYLIWPFVLAITAFRGSTFACIIVVLVCPIVRFVTWHYVGISLVAYVRSFETVADALAVGCLLAMHQQKLPRWTQSSALAMASLLCIIAGGYLASRAPVSIVFEVSIDSLLAAIVIHSLTSNNSVVSRTFSWAPFAWLGTLSYSLYLWQQLFTMESPSLQVKLWLFPYNIVGALCCACLSFYCFERPIRLWGRRFRATSDLGARPVPQAAATSA